MQRFQESLALLDVVERSGVDERLGQALGEWGGDIVEEEAVEDDGEECSGGAFSRIDGRRPLHEACSVGEVAKVKVLLKMGEGTEETDLEGFAPLHYASTRGHGAVVKLLLDAGAIVDALDKARCTPLHLAIMNEHEAIVKALLAAGADKDITDSAGDTPMDYAEAVSKAMLSLLKGVSEEVSDNEWLDGIGVGKGSHNKKKKKKKKRK